MSVPYPDPVLVSVLSTLPELTETVAGRVSTVLLPTLPAIRVTKVSDAEPPTTWEAAPIYQAEVWADDEADAGQIAWDLVNAWPTAVATVVGAARVHGRWVETNPFPSPDVDTGTPRYIVTLGIRLSGAS